MKTTTLFTVAALGAVLILAGCESAPPAADTAAVPGSPAPATKAGNLALGKAIKANGHIYDFVEASAVDGEVLSYWEGQANQFPNVITLDLDQPTEVKSMTLKLNPKRIWQARTQTVEVQVSDDGQNFTTAVPQADYAFDPEENGNAVTIDWAGTTRYLRLVITANSEAAAGQIAEWEVQ